MCARQNSKNFYIQKGFHLELTASYLRNKINTFKHITGTTICSIIGKDGWNSPFKTWCKITGIYKEDEIDPIYKKAPKYLEDKIREYVSKDKNIQFRAYDYKDTRGNIFENESLIFGGLPDGEPINEKGEIDYSNGKPMLEIKTVSIDNFERVLDENGCSKVKVDEKGVPVVSSHGTNKNKWIDAYEEIIIPKSDLKYIYQLQLYLYLRKQKKGLFAVCFLEPEDYVNYENLDISKRDIKYKEITLPDDFESTIKTCEDWYNKHVLTGISPEMSENDIEWAMKNGLID